jgi:hypothetical protein
MLVFVAEFSGFSVNVEVSVPSASQDGEQDDMKPHAETCSKHFLDSTPDFDFVSKWICSIENLNLKSITRADPGHTIYNDAE